MLSGYGSADIKLASMKRRANSCRHETCTGSADMRQTGFPRHEHVVLGSTSRQTKCHRTIHSSSHVFYTMNVLNGNLLPGAEALVAAGSSMSPCPRPITAAV